MSGKMYTEDEYKNYLKALLEGDQQVCKALVERLISQNVDTRAIYLDLFQRSLYDVGQEWEYDKISVATEHLATSITEGLMSLFYPRIFSSDKIGKTAIISCTTNEYHQVGGKMVADIMELNGWDAFFLGADTPISALSDMIRTKDPNILGLSTSVYFNITVLEDTLNILSREFPELKIIVGGQAFRWGGLDLIKQYQSTVYVSDLVSLESFLKDVD